MKIYLLWKYNTNCDARDNRSLIDVYKDNNDADAERKRRAKSEEYVGICYGVETGELK